MRKLLFLVIFFGGTAVAEPIVADGVITNVVSSIYFYASHEEMMAAVDPDDEGLKVEEDEELQGYSYCHRDLVQNIAFCEIHQVMPQQVDGSYTMTLGHEVAHGVFGVYHK